MVAPISMGAFMDFLFGFSGRIGRGGWWLGQLAIIAIFVVMVVLTSIDIGTLPKGSTGKQVLQHMSASTLMALLAMFVVATWISVAVTVKRFHDRNKPGVWFLISFVPYIGSLWLLIECGMLAGTDGPNDYDERDAERDWLRGPAPRASGTPAVTQPYMQDMPSHARRPTGPTGFGRR